MNNIITKFFGIADRQHHSLDLYDRLQDLMSLSRQRRALRSMDADRLHDLGITQQEAMIEAKKPVWDAPVHWQTRRTAAYCCDIPAQNNQI